MQVSREYLLELDKKRLKIEKEISQLTDYLNSDGMPGVSGPLIDRDGFPLQNVDISAVRTSRNKLILLQNDLSNLMKIIEEKMQIFFSKKQEVIIENKKEELLDEGIKIQVYEEEKKNDDISLKFPICWIEIVNDGSPADEAGLKAGDEIIQFDKISYGATNNPLKSISEIVSKKIDEEIKVVVKRKIDTNVEYLNIKLIPHRWEGQGVLGCKLNLEH